MIVEVESRESLLLRAESPFPRDTVLVSITDPELPEVVLPHWPEAVLRLKFDDVSDGIFEEILGRKPSVREKHMLSRRFHMFSRDQAEQLAAFLLEMRGKRVICQCEYGQSRSAAVAAAALEYFEGRGVGVFADERYYPNKLVYRLLLAALRRLDGRSCTENSTHSMVR